MATAVRLFTPGTPDTDLIVVKGMVLEGLRIDPRVLQRKVNKFWGVDGESHIWGGKGGREITIPVIIYDDAEVSPAYDSANDLADFIDDDLNGSKLGLTGSLEITSPSDHSDFVDVTFNGAVLLDGPKQDVAGTVGGDYWAICMLLFRQMS